MRIGAKAGRIGVISDTHGLLRPEVLAAFRGADLILHAGDVGGMEVLTALAKIAPVIAVRGNCDRGSWAGSLPRAAVAERGGFRLFVLHDLNELALDPAAAGFAAVVSGHSHQPALERRDGVLYLNPGSAGPRRFDLPIGAALITITGDRLNARLFQPLGGPTSL